MGTATVAHLGHINLQADAATIERLRVFYRDIVGLHEGPRPSFRSGSRGYWLYAGDHDLVHLSIAADAGKPVRPAGIAFNHVAFACSGLADTLARLRAAGIDFQIDQVDDLQQVQVFLSDPAGTGIELTFTDETLPA